MTNKTKKNRPKVTMCGIALFAATALSTMAGCQMSVGGQTLPSGYYLKDDTQYFPKGPEFKLWREAEALREARGGGDFDGGPVGGGGDVGGGGGIGN